MQLTDRWVLITGASSGFGAAAAEAFARAGCRLVLGARRQDRLAQVASACRTLGVLAEFHELDVASTGSVTAFTQWMQTLTTQVAVLINNAGQTWGAPLERFPERAWDAVQHVNVKAPFMLTQGLLPQLLATATDADPARIINIGSGRGTRIADFVQSHAPKALKIVPASTGAPTSLVADTAKLRQILGR